MIWGTLVGGLLGTSRPDDDVARRQRARLDADGPPVPARHGRDARPRPRQGWPATRCTSSSASCSRSATGSSSPSIGHAADRPRRPRRPRSRSLRRHGARQHPPPGGPPADGHRLRRRRLGAATRAARVHAAQLRPPDAARDDRLARRLRRDRRRLRRAGGLIGR